MWNEIIDNILVTICNLTLVLMLFYVVFWLHHSGWWFLILLGFHFTTDKNCQLRQWRNKDA